MSSEFQRTKLQAMFVAFDADGNGYLSRPEFAALWTQFWTSDDPAEPGNLMCGSIGTG
ncbi:hypothetical protein [Streptomyces sp. NPDC001100]